MAHAVLGAVVGHFSGNATVGAISAFTAEAAAPAIIKAMGWDKDSLTEKQKQTVSALATLAAGLAGGLVGDSSSSTVAQWLVRRLGRMRLRIIQCLGLCRHAYSRMLLWRLIRVKKERVQNRSMRQLMRHIWGLPRVQS